MGKLKAFVTREGMPDGDFKVNFEISGTSARPPRHRFRPHKLLGIDHHDMAARNAQMRKNFEFFERPGRAVPTSSLRIERRASGGRRHPSQSIMLSAHAWAGHPRTRRIGDVGFIGSYEFGASGLQVDLWDGVGISVEDKVNAYDPGRWVWKKSCSPRSAMTRGTQVIPEGYLTRLN